MWMWLDLIAAQSFCCGPNVLECHTWHTWHTCHTCHTIALIGLIICSQLISQSIVSLSSSRDSNLGRSLDLKSRSKFLFFLVILIKIFVRLGRWPHNGLWHWPRDRQQQRPSQVSDLPQCGWRRGSDCVLRAILLQEMSFQLDERSGGFSTRDGRHWNLSFR